MDNRRDQIKFESNYFTSNTDYKEEFFDDYEEENCLQIAEDNYQGDFIPQKTDFGEDSEEDSVSYKSHMSNDEEEEMLTDLRKLLASNTVYIGIIDRLVEKVTIALELNKKSQKSLAVCLNSAKMTLVNVTKRSPLALVPCLPPYFKDQFGMIPAWNIDSHRLARVYPLDPLMTVQQKWSREDHNLLVDAVIKSLSATLISPLVVKRNLLVQKLKASGVDISDEQREVWHSEIEKISRRINYLKDLSDIEILLQIGDRDVDWDKISSVEFQGSYSALQLRMRWCNECSLIFYQSEWTPEEDEFLLAMTQDLGNVSRISWGDVAVNLGTSRAPYSCFERFLLLQRQHSRKDMWSADEDKRLMSLVEKYTFRDTVNWSKVCALLPKRSKEQCEYHYKRCLKASHLQGRWTLEEDLDLFKIIDKYGPQDWQGVSSHLKKRSSLQCRDRWMNVLDPKRRNEPWLWEEHKRLFFGIEIFGQNSPAKVALLLPGRNNSDVKARVTALKRFKMMVFEAKVDKREEPTYEIAAANYKFNKRRREKVLDTFRKEAERKEMCDGNSSGLRSRVGLGSFLISSSGTQVDYSEVKLTRNADFGMSFGHSGRWIQFRKNPNEYGSQELDKALKELGNGDHERVLDFLKQSDRSFAEEVRKEKECGDDLEKQFDFYSSVITDERLTELKKQIDRLLPIGKSDVERRVERRRRYLKSGRVKLEDDDAPTRKRMGRPRKRMKVFEGYDYSSIIGC